MDIETRNDVLEALDWIDTSNYSQKTLDKIEFYRTKLTAIETEEELEEFYDNSDLEGFMEWLGIC